jgi:hypothetical protein
MKKTLTAMTLLAGAVSVYSQGAISMNDYNGGSKGFTIQVFQQQAPGVGTAVTVNGITGFEVMGQPNNSYLPGNGGSTVYAGPSTIGNGYDVGLLALGGGGATSYSQLSLVPGSVVTTWRTAGSAGGFNNNYGIWNSGATANIGPGSPATASIAIAAWKNSGTAGPAATLAAAQADGYAWGVSQLVTAALTTGTGSPGYLPTSITSFSLATTVPEPSTIALGVIGASTLLFRRRK